MSQALAAVAIAQLMVVLDVTIVNIALPSAQRDLGFSDDSWPGAGARRGALRPGAGGGALDDRVEAVPPIRDPNHGT